MTRNRILAAMLAVCILVLIWTLGTEIYSLRKRVSSLEAEVRYYESQRCGQQFLIDEQRRQLDNTPDAAQIQDLQNQIFILQGRLP